ncbi:hypothetical protein DFH09DRAFT_1309323 [Mycena vulgaris]|nr:hypothetical protein DFH09DRAFT_1309323 [Mycena vulgaris]
MRLGKALFQHVYTRLYLMLYAMKSFGVLHQTNPPYQIALMVFVKMVPVPNVSPALRRVSITILVTAPLAILEKTVLEEGPAAKTQDADAFVVFVALFASVLANPVATPEPVSAPDPAPAVQSEELVARDCLGIMGCAGGFTQVEVCVDAGFVCTNTGVLQQGFPNTPSPSCNSRCNCKITCIS